MRTRLLVVTTAFAAVTAAASATEAQVPDSTASRRPAAGPLGQRLRDRARQGRQGQPPLRELTPDERRVAEQRIRQAFQTVVRRRLNLDDEKMRRLQETDEKFDQRRRSLGSEERRARLALRAAMEDTVNRDQNRISEAIDNLIASQRRRTELLEAEQKELSSFLTPMQRAQYLSLQEQVLRRLMDGPGRGAPGGAGRPPHDRDR